jgi:hypothetical protein
MWTQTGIQHRRHGFETAPFAVTRWKANEISGNPKKVGLFSG